MTTKKTAKPAGKSQLWVAAYLDMSKQRVSQLVTDGTFPSLPNGKLDQNVCRVAYIRWLRDESRKSSTAEAAKRVQNARADRIEMLTRKDRGELILV
jgi:hypothetical protein